MIQKQMYKISFTQPVTSRRKHFAMFPQTYADKLILRLYTHSFHNNKIAVQQNPLLYL